MARRARILKSTIDAAARAERKFARTRDSFQNFAASVGIGTNNLSSDSRYGFNPISRNRIELDWMYRGSWIVGQVVDCRAEDMTKFGVTFTGETDPKEIDRIQTVARATRVWKRLEDCAKWSRLYGGAISVVLIDGQRMDTPLDIRKVGRGAFRGMLTLDRWMVEPSLENLVNEMGDPSLGQPRFYRVVADAPALPRMTIHHSRCVRMEGVELPYWQKVAENLWGMSIVERLYDRLVAFDSASNGAAQLMYRAYLRTLKIPGFREIVSAGGPALAGIRAQVEFMRLMQSNEGITVVDGEDTFEALTYTFAGVSDTMMQMGMQLSGAAHTPLVRLFGQSPGGLGSNGESELRTYYDGVNQNQEVTLRNPVDAIYRVIARSEGIPLDPSFGFSFVPLWQLTDEQKSQIAERNSNTITNVEAAGLVSPQIAMRELKQQSRTTGMWTNITDEDVVAAASAPVPTGEEALASIRGEAGGGLPTSDSPMLPLRTIGGLQVHIETPRGGTRSGVGSDGREWSVVMPADYGYIRGTDSAEGELEQMDCFVGPSPESQSAWIVDQKDLRTGEFDEHKVMLGYRSAEEALRDYDASFSDGMGADRMMSVTRMTLGRLSAWLASGDHARAVAKVRSEGRAA